MHQDEVFHGFTPWNDDNWVDRVPFTDGFQRDWQAAVPRVRRSLSGREGKTGTPMRPRLLCTFGRWKTKKKDKDSREQIYNYLHPTLPKYDALSLAPACTLFLAHFIWPSLALRCCKHLSVPWALQQPHYLFFKRHIHL